MEPSVLLLEVLSVAALATWVALKAKNRKRNVPTNSPTMAMKWLRILFGSHSKPARRCS